MVKNSKSTGKGKQISKSKAGKSGRKKNRSAPNTNKILKSDNMNDLQTELQRVNDLNKRRPANEMKNKEKRKELVFMRNNMKNKLKGKLRRKKQKAREEMGEEAAVEAGMDAKTPQTIEMLREKDETMVNEEDEELIEENQNDEYSNYFNKEYDPQILLTTSIKHTGAIFKFMKELKNTIPNSYFYYRKKVDLKAIVELAKEKGFTDIIVVYERLRKPYRMVLTHLPEGPTVEFKITNVVYHDEIPDAAKNTGFSPELIFKNFKTKNGYRLSRILHSLFPHTPQIEGRQVVTFHNQRDYVFFRHHRFIFSDEYTKVNLQEIGPRFCLRLLSIQKGTFDNQFGEYEYYYKNKMGVRRRKFNL